MASLAAAAAAAAAARDPAVDRSLRSVFGMNEKTRLFCVFFCAAVVAKLNTTNLQSC